MTVFFKITSLTALFSNLTSITTEAGVYELDFKLSAAPSLRYFNLLEGLQEIYIVNAGLSMSATKFCLDLLFNWYLKWATKFCAIIDLS